MTRGRNGEAEEQQRVDTKGLRALGAEFHRWVPSKEGESPVRSEFIVLGNMGMQQEGSH